MDLDMVFIETALEALGDVAHKLKSKRKGALCDSLIELCKIYSPKTFGKAKKENTDYYTIPTLGNSISESIRAQAYLKALIDKRV